MIDRMTKNLMFVQGLHASSDYLQRLSDNDSQQLRTYLLGMGDAKDDDEVNQWVDQIMDWGVQNHATNPFFDKLQFQINDPDQLLGQAVQAELQKKPAPGRLRVTVPIPDWKFQPREIEMDLVIPNPGEFPVAIRPDVAAVAHRLATDLAAPIGLPGKCAAIDSSKPKLATQKVKSYPNLQGDNYTYVGQVYELTVRLSDQPQDAPPVVIKANEETKIIHIQLYTAGFRLHSDDWEKGWQRNLNFYVEAAASSAVTFKLVAENHLKDRDFVGLKLQFVVEGQLIGEAFRWVEVLANDAIAPSPIETFPSEPSYPLDEGGKIRLRPSQPRNQIGVESHSFTSPDEQIHLTITIEPLRDEDEKLKWTFTSPYLEDRLPEGESLGGKRFVGEVLASFGRRSNSYGLRFHTDKDGLLCKRSIPTLRGHLKQLREYAPKQFLDVYDRALQAHKKQGQDPKEFTILFRTNDCHIPWELMPTVDDTSDDELPLLGSVHRVGRWLQGVEPFVPSPTLNLRGLALVAPIYVNNQLPEAQEERKFLEARYAPNPVIEEPDEFREFLKSGKPTGGTGILHFTGHGDCCKDSILQNWLILADGKNEDWFDIYAASDDNANKLGKLGRDVLAFFNACNVGRDVGGALKSNGGWGRVLLRQKYRGYIGPLWNVNDRQARDIAETFYQLALGKKKMPLGEVMRQIRQKFSQDNRYFTHIAYLYLGHPLAKINYTPVNGDANEQ